LLKPKIILCAGKIAAQTLLKTAESTGSLRGSVKKIRVSSEIIPLIVTYHPSALLRNEEYKRPAWEDLKMLKAWLGENSGSSGMQNKHGES
jgi:DNA polymerase